MDEEILFGLVVVVERPFPYPGATRDLLHPGRIESVLGKDFLGGGQDPRALVILAARLTGRSRIGCSSHLSFQY